MAPHSSIVAWRIPWTEEPGGQIAKSQTRLSDFHLTLKLKDLFVKVGIQALKSDSPGSSLGSPLTSYYLWVVCVRVKSLQSCPILCNAMDCTSFSVHGILQARILEWVAVPSSRGSF